MSYADSNLFQNGSFRHGAEARCAPCKECSIQAWHARASSPSREASEGQASTSMDDRSAQARESSLREFEYTFCAYAFAHSRRLEGSCARSLLNCVDGICCSCACHTAWKKKEKTQIKQQQKLKTKSTRRGGSLAVEAVPEEQGLERRRRPRRGGPRPWRSALLPSEFRFFELDLWSTKYGTRSPIHCV